MDEATWHNMCNFFSNQIEPSFKDILTVKLKTKFVTDGTS